jgi:hypothetical protein
MNLGCIDMIIHYRMPSNPRCMLIKGESKEGLVAKEEKVNLLVKEIEKLIQNMRRKLNRILLV